MIKNSRFTSKVEVMVCIAVRESEMSTELNRSRSLRGRREPCCPYGSQVGKKEGQQRIFLRAVGFP